LRCSYFLATDIFVMAPEVECRCLINFTSIGENCLFASSQGTDRIPVLLVGNKCDLTGQREVHDAEGSALAQLWGCPYIEASAKSKQNVNEVFIEIVREMNCSPLKKKRVGACCCCTLL